MAFYKASHTYTPQGPLASESFQIVHSVNMASSILRTTRFLGRIPRFLAPCKRLNSTLVETEQKGKVLVVSINRPEKRNAVNTETANELNDCFKRFEIDSNLSVAVLCGKGGYFSSGFDLDELSQRDAEEYFTLFTPPGEGHGPMVRIELNLKQFFV